MTTVLAAVCALALGGSAGFGLALAARARELARARAELRTLREQAAEARHSLRRPLTAIMGFAQLMRDMDGKLAAEKKTEYLGCVLEESEKMSALIDGLLKETR